MKNEKGITLIILVSTVLIMAIIIGTITYSSVSAIKMNNYYSMCADIELLDEKIALYYLEHKELPIKTEESKMDITTIEGYEEGNVNYNPNNNNELYKIDLSKLENLTLSRTDYYIDEQSHTIYNLHGIKIEGERYYTVPLAYTKIDE